MTGVRYEALSEPQSRVPGATLNGMGERTQTPRTAAPAVLPEAPRPTAADWTAAYPARPGAPLILDGPTLADALGLRHARPPLLAPQLVALLPLLAADLSTRQIARRLGVSPAAVHGRLRRLYRDLSVHNRVGAVCAAMACGLLDPPTPTGVR